MDVSQGRGLDCQISDLWLSNAVFRAFVWHCDHFSITVSGSKFGAVHKQSWPLIGGGCQKYLKNCQYWGEGFKNCWHGLWMPLADTANLPKIWWRVFVVVVVVVLNSKLQSKPSMWPGTQLFWLDLAETCSRHGHLLLSQLKNDT